MYNVLIVGGGIGGLAAMQLLQKDGHEVILIEKNSALRAEGAGIMLGINAVKILSSMGLGDETLRRGNSLQSFNMVDSRGRVIGQSDAGFMESQTGYKTIAIHRAELHAALSQGLSEQNIRLNSELTGLWEHEDKVLVTYSTGETESFDLVIVADGIYSSTRKLLGLATQLRYAGYTCWRFVIDRPESVSVDRGYEYWGEGKRFGVVPLGDNKLYCFATVNAAQGDQQYKSMRVAEFKELFSDFAGDIPSILQVLGDDLCLIHNDLYDQQSITMRKGRVALLGDAAHAATPNMGQGAGMALEDAYVLSQNLQKSASVDEALSTYEKRRLPRTRKIRDKSYMIGRISQWESSIAINTRNAILRMLPSKGLSKDMCKLLMNY